MEVDIIVSIALAATVMVAITQGASIIRTFAMHRTIREVLMRGSELSPELLAGMEEPARPNGDDRIGIVLVALALAIFGFGLLMNSADNLRAMSGIALFPLFVGLALLGRFWLVSRRGRDA